MKTIKFLAHITSLAVLAALLALPAAAQAQALAQTMAFEAEGTYVHVSFEPGCCDELGTISGESTLGRFSGTYRDGNGMAATGTLVLVFRHGQASLTCEYFYILIGGSGTPQGQGTPETATWAGTYVITDATGYLEGATGEGILGLSRSPDVPGTGPFFLSGTLSF